MNHHYYRSTLSLRANLWNLTNSPLLSNRLSGKIPNGHRHAILQSKTSNQESSLFPQHVKLSCQSLESNSPLLSNRSSKPLHGLRQSKTSSLRDFTQPQVLNVKLLLFERALPIIVPRVLFWKNNLWNGQFMYNL